MKMSPKAKKEAPGPSKIKAKVKTSKAKKAVLKGSHNHKKKRYTRHPRSDGPKHCGSEDSPNILGRAPQETQAWPLCSHHAPPDTESATRKTEDNTLVFLMNIKANKNQIKQAVKELCDNEANTPIGSD